MNRISTLSPNNKLISGALAPLGWFLLTILAVCLLLSLNLLWLGRLTPLAVMGIGLPQIWGLVLMIGSIGAMVLILGSKMIVRFYLRARVVGNAGDTKLQQLKLIVARQAESAGIRPPILAVYAAEEMNAFAIGMGRQDAMLVFSQSLLDALSLDELSAVTAHEITHITNGDMLALTVMQGVVNTFVHFPAYLLGTGFDRLFFRHQAGCVLCRVITLLLQAFFGGLASLVVMQFSRRREFRADAGGAHLAGRAEMLAALRSLQAGHTPEPMMQPFTVFGLNGRLQGVGLRRLFTSHPTLAERIRALSKTG